MLLVFIVVLFCVKVLRLILHVTRACGGKINIDQTKGMLLDMAVGDVLGSAPNSMTQVT